MIANAILIYECIALLLLFFLLLSLLLLCFCWFPWQERIIFGCLTIREEGNGLDACEEADRKEKKRKRHTCIW